MNDPDCEVVGTLLLPRVGRHPASPRLRFVQLDLRDPKAVRALIDEVRPDEVYHLAAESSVAASYSDPWATIENNVRAQLNLLEAARACAPSARILVVGSNEEYGAPVEGGLPLTEESPLRPGSPYAVSKLTQDFLGLQYALAHGLSVVRVRPFNHTGPGQSERFVVPAFASQIARIEAGQQEPVVRVGNLSAGRDFSDVRDIVRGYRLALLDGLDGEAYNLASGHSVSVRQVLDRLVSLSTVSVQVVVDPALLRPVDVPEVYGSAEKLHRAAGWEPRIPFEQTLADTLDYWREKVRVL
jgi:GDP-4-dehydro-6-deoxy-D-mannose reductase